MNKKARDTDREHISVCLAKCVVKETTAAHLAATGYRGYGAMGNGDYSGCEDQRDNRAL